MSTSHTQLFIASLKEMLKNTDDKTFDNLLKEPVRTEEFQVVMGCVIEDVVKGTQTLAENGSKRLMGCTVDVSVFAVLVELGMRYQKALDRQAEINRRTGDDLAKLEIFYKRDSREAFADNPDTAS